MFSGHQSVTGEQAQVNHTKQQSRVCEASPGHGLRLLQGTVLSPHTENLTDHIERNQELSGYEATKRNSWDFSVMQKKPKTKQGNVSTFHK